MFRGWSRSVKCADVMNARSSSMTMHFAWSVAPGPRTCDESYRDNAPCEGGGLTLRRQLRASRLPPTGARSCAYARPEADRRRSGGHPNNFGIRLDFRLIDQAKLTARFDLGGARSAAPSFDKLVREVCKLLQCDPVSSEVVAAAGDAPPEN